MSQCSLNLRTGFMSTAHAMCHFKRLRLTQTCQVKSTATGVLIQHKAKRNKKKTHKKKRKGMNNRSYHALQSEVGGFSCPCTCISIWHQASGRTVHTKKQKKRLHVSFFGFGAVGCGSVSSLLKGTETPVHDLVNLSCDYLLNTNKY